MPSSIVVISDDESDEEVSVVAVRPSRSTSSSSFPSVQQTASSAKIGRKDTNTILSDSEDGIETDNDDAEQDVFKLIADVAKLSPVKSRANILSSRAGNGVERTSSTSILDTVSGDGIGVSGRAKGKGRALEGTRSMIEGMSTIDRLDAMEDPYLSSPVAPRVATKRPPAADTAGARKKTKPSGQNSEGLSKEQLAAIKASAREAKAAQDAKDKEAKQLAKDTAKAKAEKSLEKKMKHVNKLRVSKNDTVREVALYLSADMAKPSSPIAGALPEITTKLKDNQSDLHFMSDSDSPIPGAIRFKRHLKSRWDVVVKRFIPLDQPRWVWEKTVLILITAEELVDKIADGDDALVQWASDVRLLLSLSQQDQVIIMIKGIEKYYSKSKSMANKDYMSAARAGLEGGAVGGAMTAGRRAVRPTKDRIEEELVKLQVAEGCFLVHVEKTEDLEDWVFNIAADVAIRPYKLISKSHLAFAPQDGQKKALESTAVLELMLQEVQGVTTSAAAGIAAEYPTFRDLMEAFEEAEEGPRGKSGAEAMLANCKVATLVSGKASNKTVNKAVSKRVQNVMRSTNGSNLV
ncbi:hypothetical protein I350_08200 [Cryptococcus amylolentus CBS 6273]|uniref:ERCC4 domain-containing protein n=1 Tax=Cryptococcus amylolentus CBS 6273 TaxID=1296118 RepID=A0A1E3J8L9_9TREE|nr:hypothetical protein I350_08200 [Cryptococcus amylolentus CBS 6273]